MTELVRMVGKVFRYQYQPTLFFSSLTSMLFAMWVLSPTSYDDMALMSEVLHSLTGAHITPGIWALFFVIHAGLGFSSLIEQHGARHAIIAATVGTVLWSFTAAMHAAAQGWIPGPSLGIAFQNMWLIWVWQNDDAR